MGAIIKPKGGWAVSEFTVTDNGNEDSAQGESYSAVRALAGWSGIHENTIYRILCQKRKWVQIDTLDKLLCALDVPQLWFSEPLREFYYGENYDANDYRRTYHEQHYDPKAA